jgi:hypothetical protein
MSSRTHRVVAALALALVVGCGGRDATLDRHVEDLVSIQHGLYGQVTAVDDVGSPAPTYLPGFGVEAFAVPAGTTLGAPEASTTSAARGFYELALPTGDHVVCSSYGRCVVVTLADGELRRLDYEFSVGPGWSAGTPWPSAP